MKTFMQRKEDVDRKWYVVDAEGLPLGRMASEVAKRLRGKHKPTFTPHVDGGDFIIIINADKVKLSGNKLDNKIYYDHAGYPGGLKKRTARAVLESNPVEIVERAVKGMLPKGALGDQMYRKLKVYAGSTHEHEAQKPTELTID